MRKSLKSRLALATLFGAATLAAGHAPAQTVSENRPAQDQLTVTGQRRPQAEAPRSATCETLARDSHFRSLLNTTRRLDLLSPPMYMPTRLPRNPDYLAPPSVPAGSALPTLPKSRFGMRDLVLNSGEGADPAAGSAMEGGFADAQAYCRALYQRGGATFTADADGNTSFRAGGYPNAASAQLENAGYVNTREAHFGYAQARYTSGRATIVANDKTLPTAFALFDQGRYAESFEWFRKASNKLEYRAGGDEAALFVGKLYLQGLGEKSDTTKALEWLAKTATMPFDPTLETSVFDPKEPERNTAVGEAAVILANLYRNGFRGVPKNPAEARKWYARAFAVGHIPAAVALGDMSLDGIGSPRDPRKAASYYRQAAKLGHFSAQFALAEILHQGDQGVAQDRKQALGWYQEAAKGEHAGALFALGRAYDLGEGVKADPQLAMGFYKSAALGGNPAAMAAMGTYFYEGKLVARDPATARRWFESAAAGGDADGAFNLAAMLANAEGGPKDMAKALHWMKQAVALGHPNAPRALAALEQRMTPEERKATSAKS